MCDIFPDVENCCFVINLRVGMLLVSILAIMTGVIGLSVIEQRSNINYYKVQNFSHINQPQDAMDKLNDLVSSGISGMSCVFMVTGLCLLYGSLWDGEGAIQIFVWFTFFNVIFGFFMVLATAFECMVKTSCILSDMDWLSGSGVLILIISYLFLWIYFICVANSYVTGIFT